MNLGDSKLNRSCWSTGGVVIEIKSHELAFCKPTASRVEGGESYRQMVNDKAFE